MVTLTVRNPVARLTAALEPPAGGVTVSTRAPRATSLGGSTIGLWWNLKVGGDVALEWLGSALAAEHGSTSARFYGRYPGAPALINEAAERSTAVIGASGD
jgi:hypothetical protein